MEVLADFGIVVVFEASDDVLGRGGPSYLHVLLVWGVDEGEQVECVFGYDTLLLELGDSLGVLIVNP